MGWIEIIGTVLKFLIDLWNNNHSTDPEQVKLKAVAAATKEMNDDVESFNKALAVNDAESIAIHFEQLAARVRTHAGSGGSGQP